MLFLSAIVLVRLLGGDLTAVGDLRVVADVDDREGALVQERRTDYSVSHARLGQNGNAVVC